MNPIRKGLWASLGCLLLFVFACVTINIYFPAEKVESVAGDIVDDIRGREPAKKDKESMILDRVLAGLDHVPFSVSCAWAGEMTEVSNPTIRALKAKMKARYGQLKSFYGSGHLKEGNNGYLSIVKTDGLGLKQKRDLKALVDAENGDRKALYAEVAKALKIDGSQVGKVGEIFAKEWQK